MNNIQIAGIRKEGIEKGIFFRFPIQKREIYLYGLDFDSEIKNPIYDTSIKGFIGKLINPQWKFHKEFIETQDDAAGYDWNEFCSPIYFERIMIKCEYIIKNHSFVDKIVSYGWEPYKNNCGGACEKEITKIYFNDGKVRTIIKKDYFYYTYKHIVEESLKNNLFE